MKKYVFILLAVLIFSCKKEKQPAPQGDGKLHYPRGYYDIYVNSNYMYPYLRIVKGGSAGFIIHEDNYGSSISAPVSVHYKLNVNTIDQYDIYTLSHTISGKMLDNKKVWNRLIVVNGKDTIYDHLNNDSTYTSVDNNFEFISR